MATEAQIRALTASPVARIAKASDTGQVFLIPALIAGSDATPLSSSQLVWHLRQADQSRPGADIAIPSWMNGSYTLGSSSQPFVYNIDNGPAMFGSTNGSTRPSYWVTSASYGGFLIWGGNGSVVSASNNGAIGISSASFMSATGQGSGSNAPSRIGPSLEAYAGGGTYAAPSSMKLYASGSSGGPVWSFFKDYLWHRVRARSYFSTVLDALNAGGPYSDYREWEAPTDGVYYVEFRVPGRWNGTNNEWNYDLLVQDADNSSFTSLVNLGAARGQEEFVASGIAAKHRGARVHSYSLRMNAGQKLRLVLRSFVTVPISVPFDYTAYPKGFSGSTPPTSWVRTGSGRAHPAGMVIQVASNWVTASSLAPAVAARYYDQVSTGADQGDEGRQYSLKLYRIA